MSVALRCGGSLRFAGEAPARRGLAALARGAGRGKVQVTRSGLELSLDGATADTLDEVAAAVEALEALARNAVAGRMEVVLPELGLVARVAAGGPCRVLKPDPPLRPGEGAALLRLEHLATITCTDFSPDGCVLAVGGGVTEPWNARALRPPARAPTSREADVCCWDAGTGQLLARLAGPRDWVQALAFSPCGTQLAAGDTRGGVWLWDWRGEVVLARRGQGAGPVRRLAFSPSGDRLLVVAHAKCARVLAVPGLAIAAELTHDVVVEDGVFLSDTRVVVRAGGAWNRAGTACDNLVAWSLGSPPARVATGRSLGAYLAVSPSRRRMASVGGVGVTVLDAASLAPLAELPRERGGWDGDLRWAAWRSDDEVVAAGDSATVVFRPDDGGLGVAARPARFLRGASLVPGSNTPVIGGTPDHALAQLTLPAVVSGTSPAAATGGPARTRAEWQVVVGRLCARREWTWSGAHGARNGVHTHEGCLVWYTEYANPHGGGGAREQEFVDYLREGAVLDLPTVVREELDACVRLILG